MKQPISPTQRALNLWAVVLIIWAFYRAKFGTSLPPWFDELVAKPVVFILPVYYYVTQVEKRNFLDGIWLHFNNWKKMLLLGTGIGMIFITTGIFGNYLKFHTLGLQNLMTPGIIGTVILAFATAISEEIISRGFITKRLYEEGHNIFSSTLNGSLLFFFLHVPILFSNAHMVGFVLIRVMLTDLILGVATSYFFLERKSLVLPILIHMFYSLSIILFI